MTFVIAARGRESLLSAPRGAGLIERTVRPKQTGGEDFRHRRPRGESELASAAATDERQAERGEAQERDG